MNKIHWTSIKLKTKSSANQKYFEHVHLWARWKRDNPFLCLQFSGSNDDEQKAIEKKCN